MKRDPQPALDAYRALLAAGPSGLLSARDMQRLDDHLADAAAAVPLLTGVGRIVDVGTGAGLPGLVLAILLPAARVELVESLGWKCAFLEHCVQALDLAPRVTVHCVRAEEAPGVIGREACDAGTARALAAPSVVCEYLSPLVRPGGLVVAYTTGRVAADDLPPAVARTELGLGEARIVQAPSALRTDGVLAVWDKVAPCAMRFPRRTGVAVRRPLA